MDELRFWSPGGDVETKEQALMRSLADARRSAALLEHRAGEPEALEEERLALEALARSEKILVELGHAEAHLLRRQTLSDVSVELEAARCAAHSYVSARARSDHSQMRAAARELQRSATLAAAIFDEAIALSTQ